MPYSTIKILSHILTNYIVSFEQLGPDCVNMQADLNHSYCVFDIFLKVGFCLGLCTEEVNLQTFVMI